MEQNDELMTIMHGRALRDEIRKGQKLSVETQSTASQILDILSSSEGETLLQTVERIEAKADMLLAMLTILTRREAVPGAAPVP